VLIVTLLVAYTARMRSQTSLCRSSPTAKVYLDSNEAAVASN